MSQPDRQGRSRLYCSTACRKRAFRRRHANAVEFAGEVIALRPEPVQVNNGHTDEQVARAIMTARAAAYSLQRLGNEARPELSWRCTKLGDVIAAGLSEFFPETER